MTAPQSTATGPRSISVPVSLFYKILEQHKLAADALTDEHGEVHRYIEREMEKLESLSPETFLGPCSCSDGGKCKHNATGPLCMQEGSAPSETAALLPGLKAALEIAERYRNVDGVYFLRNDLKDAILKEGTPPSARAMSDPILPDELYSIADNELAKYPSAAEYCRKAGHELRLSRALSPEAIIAESTASSTVEPDAYEQAIKDSIGSILSPYAAGLIFERARKILGGQMNTPNDKSHREFAATMAQEYGPEAGEAVANYLRTSGRLDPVEVTRKIALDVQEIPDRTSPDDQPDMCLVTPNELRRIVHDRLMEAMLAERVAVSHVAAPTGWVASHSERNTTLHFSKADGWTVEPVTFAPPSSEAPIKYGLCKVHGTERDAAGCRQCDPEWP